MGHPVRTISEDTTSSEESRWLPIMWKHGEDLRNSVDLNSNQRRSLSEPITVLT